MRRRGHPSLRLAAGAARWTSGALSVRTVLWGAKVTRVWARSAPNSQLVAA